MRTRPCGGRRQLHGRRGPGLGNRGGSGNGKSVTALSIMRLVPTPPGEIADGVLRFRGRDLLLLSEPSMRAVRGDEIGMIFQEPMSSLNPLLTADEQIAEVVRLHRASGRRRRVAMPWRCWRA